MRKKRLTLEKDKEDQSKYYLSYPKLPVLDMKWKNHDVNVLEWANIPKFPLMECLTPTVNFDIFMDNYFTSFRLLTYLGVINI